MPLPTTAKEMLTNTAPTPRKPQLVQLTMGEYPKEKQNKNTSANLRLCVMGCVLCFSSYSSFALLDFYSMEGSRLGTPLLCSPTWPRSALPHLLLTESSAVGLPSQSRKHNGPCGWRGTALAPSLAGRTSIRTTAWFCQRVGMNTEHLLPPADSPLIHSIRLSAENPLGVPSGGEK